MYINLTLQNRLCKNLYRTENNSKKMKRVLILFFFVCLPLVSAEVDNYNNVSSLTMNVDISSDIQKTKGITQELSAELEFYPKEYMQQTILSEKFISDPEAEVTVTENGLLYLWNTDATSYHFGTQSTVQVENKLIKVYDKIPYPSPIDEEVQVYTLETEIIDITPEMDALAEELLAGEDDLYKAVFILANWTQHNVEYNLSTLNVQASQKSSYVLETREGVCDEITNLFISLARSRGIPARFASGMVYSNLNTQFGAHGWAEVYIDGQWIPVDVTFGTIGWIDPSHIKFKDELGSNEASVAYEWIGSNVAFDIGVVNFSTDIEDMGSSAEEYIDIEVEALKENAGPGSYIPLQITLSNPNNFYVPVQLYLTKAPGVVGKNTKNVFLAPKEEKSAFWIIQIPEDIDPLYLYTTTIQVQTMYGGLAETSFDYASIYDVYTEEEAEEIISSLLIDERKPYLDDVSLDCSLDKDLYYKTETAQLSCRIDGNSDKVQVCFQEECQDAAESMTWALPLTEYDSQRLMVSAERNGEARYSYFDLNIITLPNLHIEDITPKEIDFSKKEDFLFTLVTDSSVEDVIVTIENVVSFSLSHLDGEKEITTEIEGKALASGEIVFTLEYTDSLGTKYTEEQRESIVVNNIPWWYELWLKILSLLE